MLRLLTLFLAATTFGNGAAVNDFNDHVDEAVGRHQPSVIRNKRSLHLEARIPYHEFQVASNGLFNRDLQVKLTVGAVRGLDDVTRRLRRCVGTTCLVDLRGLVVSYIAQTRGDDLVGTRKNIWVEVRVTSAEALFNMSDIRAREGSLNSLFIGPITTFASSYDTYLDLNSGRRREFVEEVARYTRWELRQDPSWELLGGF
uniref:Putative secreted protein n=1 Tax=Ixodes ricinus TaxID=34613 RepID=V5GH49_IXORI